MATTMSSTTVGRFALECSDQDLIDSHRYGDSAAFEEIYRRFGPMVYNLALRLSGDPDDAGDLTQEAFLRIYRHLSKFRGRSSLKTWVYRVALNHCRSSLGRRRQPDQPYPQGFDEVVKDPRRTPEDRILAGDAGKLLGKALSQLKPVFREAVVLRDLEELSYEEIAEILRVRVGTVRSRIARGRDRLREVLLEGASS